MVGSTGNDLLDEFDAAAELEIALHFDGGQARVLVGGSVLGKAGSGGEITLGLGLAHGLDHDLKGGDALGGETVGDLAGLAVLAALGPAGTFSFAPGRH